MSEKKTFVFITGMTCSHCEQRISAAVERLPGVVSVSASFPKGSAEIVFDAEKVSQQQIQAAIENQGYKVKGFGMEGKRHPVSKVAPVMLIIVALYFLIRYTVGFDFFNLIPKIDTTVSLVALFVTGLMTSVHCIAMCGGINLSQSVGASEEKKSKITRPLLYNLGRVVSYTLVGGIVGGIGSALFISITAKGIIMLAAAVFMILMSLAMLGWLPHWLVPRLPKKWSHKAAKDKANKGPFIVGLLNGLLPCGPLQAMQLYALSTGSILMGALSMFLFAAGTVPLMLGAGFVFSALKGKFSRGITRVSAALVMLIAVVMFVNAAGFFGINLFGAPSSQTAEAKGQAVSSEAPSATAPQYEGYDVAAIKDGVQYVEGNLDPSGYPAIVVQKGIPVKFNIKATDEDINGCNAAIIIPKFNIEKDLKAGDNIIEFTPEETGTIPYTCWMAMIQSRIVVVDSLETPSAVSEALKENPASGSVSGGCCAASTATRFAGGKIPTDDIAVAKISGDEQMLTVTVNDEGYSPAVLVVQKGVALKIKFNPEKINGCNGIVAFPELDGALYLSEGELETPWITPDKDFVFECGMSMLHGYVKVVDDIGNIDMDAIKAEVAQYKPKNNLNISGCCGY